MFSTSYKPLTALSKRLPYDGGICQWWFTPIQNIDQWPHINPATQSLAAEPTLKEGKSWYGPLSVPTNQLGWEEAQERSKPGFFFKQKIEGIYPGDDSNSRPNLDNMIYNQYVVVIKQRAGGMCLILGNKNVGLDFDHTFSSKGSATAQTKFVFSGESLTKALMLPSFTPDDYELPPGSVPPIGGGSAGGGGGIATGEATIIAVNELQTIISWDDEMKEKHGLFPHIQVWYDEDGKITKQNMVSIEVDDLPPNASMFYINHMAAIPGFIVIK